ncbi:hypothetical protein A3A76_06095 [Candidatus Woesebacteria bacterium RIFCSPLOWO2_01_FULL_39_23]|uniref:Serine hydrolase family protein n=1 Tax=Candidatus Woesebacteria bacterium RIFCSPHIGHO2_01_FULL_40_22 TaxID=1802499 RepID=A0A1F7YI45_9BACT|nr:MAG: hypothetical protein A2141_02790 [Candidatus Woesebacteria bacterium RBG_16_40_11]OGM26973.1 MAG: hypothetical protein A2628_06035 [Candidatus Woesebacteria bacterium RIFCSPHIGHO2_01_FULL_40_22]OGM37380.1 MAG: hypothetical protein A3E41_04440 [Candidatus Woesebacteria bacterium RIFCSPHIGHO2_12_FULL_38_9]OGM63248.1 MAG: hypothetical protein A3A76_06095 [Candidatus Woesebacteria bacterium RIFCSPLOWO2_01_FULL_39_23]
MKRAIIIHCWEGFPNYCWYPQTKKDLEKEGFEVIVPEMPDTAKPQLGPWLANLKEIAGKANNELFLLGHSLGCITIMRYLESLKNGEQVGGVVFVAGFTDDLGYKELSNFFIEPINFKKIEERSRMFSLINSDNDPYVPPKYVDILKDKLGAKSIVKHNMKHFSGPIDNEESCLSLPEVKEEIMRMSHSVLSGTEK